MGAITPSFLMDLESRMQVVSENEYARLTSNLWWQRVAKVKTSTSKRELMSWILSTMQIRDIGQGGNLSFDDLVMQQTEYEHTNAGAGLKVSMNQLTDLDGNGVDLAAAWAAQAGAYMAYWPQKKVSEFLKTAHLAASSGGFSSYDGVPFFSASHPINPYRTSLGNYSNLITGHNIDDSVTLDVAIQNLAKVMAHVASFKMPNGVDPRYLRPTGLIVPPRMFPRAVQLTSAKFIAEAASSGGGSADASQLIQALGFSAPTRAEELAGFESDKTYFVACEQVTSNEVGGVIYSNRENFRVSYYGAQTEAQLSRMDEAEWHVKGRNAVAPGHPYLLIKVDGT